MDLMARRRMMMAKKALPYDAEVEYLKSSGTQYIEIPVFYNVDNKYEIDYNVVFDTSSQQFNGWDAGGATGIGNNGKPNDGGTVVGFGVDIVGGQAHFNSVINSGTSSYTVTTVTFNGNNYTNSRVHSSLGNYAASYGYVIFACRSQSIIKYYCYEKLYDFKIKINDFLVFDAIPVRIGQVGYMYDKVSKQLFGNAGTGSFVLGNDVN